MASWGWTTSWWDRVGDPVQRLSLAAGPLRLLDGDFPDRAFMRGIAERHLSEALAQFSVVSARRYVW